MRFIDANSSHPDVSVEDIEKAYDNMFLIFRAVYPEMSETLANYIRAKARVVFFEKEEVILDYQKVCNYVLFSFKGIIRSNFIIDGKEIPVWYNTPRNVVIAVHSWYTRQPSEEKLTATQDTLCTVLSWDDMEDIYSKHVEFNILVRKLTEIYIQQILPRTLWIHYDAYQKYKMGITNYWKIVSEISTSELAKFLGLARETLSRIRNRKWMLI